MNVEEQAYDLKQRLDREVLLQRTTRRIRNSLELQEILDAAAVETRAFLGVDRVKIYRFNQDASGEVIAESVCEDRLPSLLGLNFPADDIPPHARERFVKERIRSVINVCQNTIGLTHADRNEVLSDGGEHRTLDPCHAEYLTSMGVASSLCVPILHNETLWGLMVAHHVTPRQYDRPTLELVQAVVDQVSIAISQSELLAETRRQTERQATVNRISALLHAQPTVELTAALEATIEALGGVGGQLYINGDRPLRLLRGQQPQLTTPGFLEDAFSKWQAAEGTTDAAGNQFPLHTHNLKTVPALANVAPDFQSSHLRGVLVLPLYHRQKFLGYLSVFRPETNTEIWWAGQFDPNERQQRPRQSFEAWRQLKRGQSEAWGHGDRELARDLSERFASAIQQYLLYREVQTLNATLEKQVGERTAQLQQSLEFTEALAQIADRIRSSLNLDCILQTIVREVRDLLHADRVVIYQVFEEGDGCITVEDVQGDWVSAKGIETPPGCFPKHLHEKYSQTRRAHFCNDVQNAPLSPCHREFLESLQIRANLIVPIHCNDKLWGLIISHQCGRPRSWCQREIDLVEQLSRHAAIAISQVELFTQSQRATAEATAKAEELERALIELKQTQTQLIQSEKMSSLGQLVAGVAHEINNPVNFIYGNLVHTSEYTQDLIDLLQLYQERYPQPDPTISERAEDIDLDFLIEDLPHMLGSMKLGADRIRQIVLSLRNFSRLDQSELKPVNLHEGLEGTLTILHHRLKARADRAAINIVKEYGELPPVECFAGQLNQVFMNLISNAIDALDKFDSSKGDRTIGIRTECLNDNRVRVTITDNGCGIPEKVRSRIFDPFFTTKPVGIGTGLGLSISYQIVADKHHGSFDCRSQVGAGTEFCLEIPIHQSPRRHVQHDENAASTAKI